MNELKVSEAKMTEEPCLWYVIDSDMSPYGAPWAWIPPPTPEELRTIYKDKEIIRVACVSVPF